MVNAKFRFSIDTKHVECFVVTAADARNVWDNLTDFNHLPDFCVSHQVDGETVPLFYVKVTLAEWRKTSNGVTRRKQLSWKVLETVLNTMTDRIAVRYLKEYLNLSELDQSHQFILTELSGSIKPLLKQSLQKLTDSQHAKNVIGYEPRNNYSPMTISAQLSTSAQCFVSTRTIWPSSYATRSEMWILGTKFACFVWNGSYDIQQFMTPAQIRLLTKEALIRYFQFLTYLPDTKLG